MRDGVVSMSMRCPECDGEVQVFDSNGADYPETRVEQVRSQVCDHEFTNTLTP